MLKQKFAIALAAANMRQRDFARLHGVHDSTITLLLHGKMKSKRLTAIVNDFINQEFEKLTPTTGCETTHNSK